MKPDDRRKEGRVAEPVTQGQFYEAMRALDDKLQQHHKSQREHIDNSCERILRQFDAHESVDRAVADRVLTIETERAIEKRVAARNSAIYGSVAAGSLLALIEALKRVFGAHP